MENMLYLVRHGFYFAIMIALPLLALAQLSGTMARRRGLQPTVFGGGKALHICLLICLCGGGGQFLFQTLIMAHCAPAVARMIGLAAATGAAAWITAPIISYFCRWKGTLYGVLAAAPATLLYQQLAPIQEWEARTAVAGTLVACITFAVTYPIPQQALIAAEAGAQRIGILSESLALRPDGLIRPADILVQPATILISSTSPCKRRSRKS